MLFSVVLFLFWSLVAVVHSHTEYPYVSFVGVNLPNHAYVDLATVGLDASASGDTVRCHTDLTSCCSRTQGDHRGELYFPDGNVLDKAMGSGDIYKRRGPQVIHIRRRNDATSPSGIYRCEIPTVAVHDVDRITGETVYVGLYPPNEGDISIPDGVTLSMNTLTCISTGGPATTVTWTRDSVTITEGTETVLNSPVTAQYTHTVNVTSGGLYTCTVANNKPSTASATITLQGATPPTNLTAVQTGPTSIDVSWTPPTPLGDITGYIIYYTNDDNTDSDSVVIDGGSTDEYTLSDLQNGDTYIISIIATSSSDLPSESVLADIMTVGLIPDTPVITVDSTTATTITISGGVPSDSVADNYEVMWETDDVGRCSGGSDMDSTTITDGSTSYEITGLEEDSTYSITVTASNSAGSSAVSNTVTPMTMEAAPSAAPTNVSVSEVTSSSITVQWGTLPCIHRNGDITNYKVRYGEVGIGEGDRTIMTVSGDSSGGMYTITGLSTGTVYTVEVAAKTTAGTGVYSHQISSNNVYLSLNGVVIPNHGYVIINDIGSDGDDTALLCHTNHPADIPGGTDGRYSGGDWFSPDQSEVLPDSVGFRRGRGSMVVRLYRVTGTTPVEGIYHCVIEDDTNTVQRVFVGLYYANDSRGNVTISGDMKLTEVSDLNGDSPQFTLTCISIGGPATTVTWTRDSVPAIGEAETVLNDPVTAQYTHTLTVTERLEELYKCSVVNNKPSSDKAYYIPDIKISLKSSLPKSLEVSWTVQLVNPTSYSISYFNVETSCFEDNIHTSGYTDTIYTLANLKAGTNYSITVNATVTLNEGTIFKANAITATTIGVDAPSAAPTFVSVSALSSTALIVQWGTVPCIEQNGDITGYSVQYRVVGSESIQNMSVSGANVTEATISNLIPSTNYFIEVAAVNRAGIGVYSTSLVVETPYSDVFLSLNGVVIPNNGYVIISDIGTANDDIALLCHTNHPADIPGGTDGMHSGGDWFRPDGSEVSFGASSVGFRRNRGSMVVKLYRNTASTDPPVEGIYRCVVMDANDTLQTVYVGLYNDDGGGDITMSDGVILTVDSDLNGASPQFTLTCISTGGPATTVTWTRDSVTITEGTETVLNDPVTAQYTHTLTVTERLGGLYTCTVANNKPSSDSAQLNDLKMFVAAPGQRTVKFSWSTLLAGHSYNLSCGAPPLPSFIFVSISPSQLTSLTVEGFSPNTSYLCVVETNQSFIPTFIDFTTLQDYSFFQSTQSPDDSSSMSLELIIGIVVAVIIFIIIHIILVTAILVYRHGNKKKDTTINRKAVPSVYVDNEDTVGVSEVRASSKEMDNLKVEDKNEDMNNKENYEIVDEPLHVDNITIMYEKVPSNAYLPDSPHSDDDYEEAATVGEKNSGIYINVRSHW